MTIKEFIKKRKYLIWYTNNFDNLNDEAIIEATLNYGDWDDIQKLIKILGIKNVARIFRAQVQRLRVNYDPMTANYFTLYFRKHANIKIKQPENIRWRFCKCGGLR